MSELLTPTMCVARGGHVWSPEIDQDGQVVLDERDGLPRADGLAHAPGTFVCVCPRCRLVQVHTYGKDGSAVYNIFDYDNTVRAALDRSGIKVQ